MLPPLALISLAHASGVPQVATRLSVLSGGTAGPEWEQVIRDRHPDGRSVELVRERHPLQEIERKWKAMIEHRIPIWRKGLDRLAIPFPGVAPAPIVRILFGNRGGDDGFTHGLDTICLDLSSWARAYGDSSTSGNAERIDRILSHEYTHLLTRAWMAKHPFPTDSPCRRALHELFHEGLGNLRSLSGKWLPVNGKPSAAAREVLDRHSPTLVNRLVALTTATPNQERILMKGMSSGPFTEKWGALPVALWLAIDTNADERELGKWVQAGPQGVLDLARKYLPEDLGRKLPK